MSEGKCLGGEKCPNKAAGSTPTYIRYEENFDFRRIKVLLRDCQHWLRHPEKNRVQVVLSRIKGAARDGTRLHIGSLHPG